MEVGRNVVLVPVVLIVDVNRSVWIIVVVLRRVDRSIGKVGIAVPQAHVIFLVVARSIIKVVRFRSEITGISCADATREGEQNEKGKSDG